MGYPASGKAEIIRLLEQSHLPVRRTLEKLGVPRATVWRWGSCFALGRSADGTGFNLQVRKRPVGGQALLHAKSYL